MCIDHYALLIDICSVYRLRAQALFFSACPRNDNSTITFSVLDDDDAAAYTKQRSTLYTNGDRFPKPSKSNQFVTFAFTLPREYSYSEREGLPSEKPIGPSRGSSLSISRGILPSLQARAPLNQDNNASRVPPAQVPIESRTETTISL